MYCVKTTSPADLIRDSLHCLERIWRRLPKPCSILIDRRSTTCAALVRNTVQNGAALAGSTSVRGVVGWTWDIKVGGYQRQRFRKKGGLMPAPQEIPAGLEVLVVDHPLATSRLSIMRDLRTDDATFRAALRDLTMMLVYEASRNLTTELIPIDTPVLRPARYGWPTRRYWSPCCGRGLAWLTRLMH
jgi:hypothetical protein